LHQQPRTDNRAYDIGCRLSVAGCWKKPAPLRLALALAPTTKN
jgi:hypothetical protein